MKVTVDIPDREWAVLLDRAEANGLKVPELLHMAIRSVFPHTRPMGEDVLILVRAGFPDRQVAERLGVTNAVVQRLRRKAGLPANRFARSDP